ncbi:antitoxin VapB family protein [Candidatus Marsarchaeota archaeon]|nr:antitoxin VapB family protein [Candidatus Marsarchaeota archaeon]MCL5090369.1 antitoxin VapB family protein [Candidatus Marsarchaeota archaeon]
MINVKTIMISDETYRKLAAIKDKKSFTILLSEMVDKLKQNNKDKILKFAGIIDIKDAEELQNFVVKIRKRAGSRI